jgi:hypothetical protein
MTRQARNNHFLSNSVRSVCNQAIVYLAAAVCYEMLTEIKRRSKPNQQIVVWYILVSGKIKTK